MGAGRRLAGHRAASRSRLAGRQGLRALGRPVRRSGGDPAIRLFLSHQELPFHPSSHQYLATLTARLSPTPQSRCIVSRTGARPGEAEKGGAEHVREVHRPGAAGRGPGPGRGQDAATTTTSILSISCSASSTRARGWRPGHWRGWGSPRTRCAGRSWRSSAGGSAPRAPGTYRSRRAPRRCSSYPCGRLCSSVIRTSAPSTSCWA